MYIVKLNYLCNIARFLQYEIALQKEANGGRDLTLSHVHHPHDNNYNKYVKNAEFTLQGTIFIILCVVNIKKYTSARPNLPAATTVHVYYTAFY